MNDEVFGRKLYLILILCHFPKNAYFLKNNYVYLINNFTEIINFIRYFRLNLL